MKPTYQEIMGLLSVPFVYLVVTFVIAFSAGRNFDKQWAVFGWENELPERLKTWAVGALGTICFLAVAPFMQSLYELCERFITSLPFVFQPILALAAGASGMYLLFVLVTLPMLCMKACCKVGYEL